jgi:hypothetical protein
MIVVADHGISDTLSEAAAEMRGELKKMPDSHPPGQPPA